MVDPGQKVEQLLDRVSTKKPELVEFRLDKLSDFETIEEIARKKTFKAIATDKSHRDPRARRKLLLAAAAGGFDFIDVELASASPSVSEVKSFGREVIVSFHDSLKTPSGPELRNVLDLEVRTGGDVCKVVTTAHSQNDNLSILQFVAEKAKEARLVAFAMGRLGMPSRILSPFFGAEFTFACLSDAEKTADGQMTIDDMRSAWQLLGIQ